MHNSPYAPMLPSTSLEAEPPALHVAPPVVLFVHGSAEMYGSDKVLLNLAQSLSTDSEFTPVVVLHEDGPLRRALQASGVEVHLGTVVKITRSLFAPSAVPKLIRMVSQSFRDLDAVVAGREVALVHSNTLAVLGGALWAWRRRRRHLWHVHEIILKPTLVSRGLPWLASRLSHAVLAVSTPTEKWLLAQQPQLGPRLQVVFNGLPQPPPVDEIAVVATRLFRTRISASDGDVVVTLAGRLNHMKGQGLLIEALGILQHEGRLGRIRVVFVGDVYAGHEDPRPRLRARLAEVGLMGLVNFLSFEPDIYSVWRGTQIAVVPSTEPESFGMVAIEAMACGLPVLAAGHGGLLDIVLPEETGLLFEPGNAAALAEALARLSADPALRARLGAAGAQRQREVFSMDRQAERTRAVYRELVAA
jgi:glycosyltransferase involved in cell wall biosynthesis